MKILRAGWRLLRVLAHLLNGAWIIRRRISRLDFEHRQALVQDWSRRLLGLLLAEVAENTLSHRWGVPRQ